MPIVLMLEDDRERVDRFEAVAAKLGAELVIWADAHRMLAELPSHLASAALISLDHDLLPLRDVDPGDGLDVAKHLATLAPACPVIVHTSNRIRGDAMMGALELAGWEHHRVPPIGDDWIEVDWFRQARRLLRSRRTTE
ncbi:MAG TPA: cyclic-phosphate processing receiver domain-containing protein [Gemmata sp.]